MVDVTDAVPVQGSCDAGKRYCCNKEPRGLGAPRPGGYGATPGGALGAPGGGPAGYYGKPAILTGPGGPGSGSGSYGGSYGGSPYKVSR